MDIRVSYRAVDGCRMVRRFKTLAGAQRFAHKYVGEHPECGTGYAVSDDGVGKVTVQGCTLRDLFPAPATPSDCERAMREQTDAWGECPF